MIGVLLLGLTGVSYLADTVAISEIEISALPAPAPPPEGSNLAPGQALVIEQPAQSPVFNVHKGKAHLDSGRQIYRIEVNPALSHRVQVNFIWTNPATTPGVLRNGFMLVALYYKTGEPPCASTEFVIKDKLDVDICVAPAADQSSLFGQAILTKINPTAVLKSTQSNQNFLYLLASVWNQGGTLPPGEQGDIGTLTFFMTGTAK